ncbi:hypothetical protein OAT84_01895 [Gammaproteobacteria bacterium]|nr:hypothetical protein [Gammaproteobacteria bacterium]
MSISVVNLYAWVVFMCLAWLALVGGCANILIKMVNNMIKYFTPKSRDNARTLATLATMQYMTTALVGGGFSAQINIFWLKLKAVFHLVCADMYDFFHTEKLTDYSNEILAEQVVKCASGVVTHMCKGATALFSSLFLVSAGNCSASSRAASKSDQGWLGYIS